MRPGSLGIPGLIAGLIAAAAGALIGAGLGAPTPARAARAQQTSPQAPPPNVVLIVIDTLRPDFLGCYGDTRGLSPAIDQLARDGVLFENAIATSPITGPSHASLFTSRWACETGVLNNFGGAPRDSLPMLAELMRDAGYHTGAVIAISAVCSQAGFARGFGQFTERLGVGGLATAGAVVTEARDLLARTQPPFLLWTHFSDPHEPYDAHGLVRREAEVLLDGQSLARVPTSDYSPLTLELKLPARAADLAIRSKDVFHVRALELAGPDGPKPTVSPAELPWEALPEYHAQIGADGARRVQLDLFLCDEFAERRNIRERYGREVAAADQGVGAVLDELRRRGLYDDALIVFASDHGESLGERGLVGHVENLYDVLVRVPLIVKLPRDGGAWAGARGGELAGVRRRDLVSLVDVVPTVLARLGRPLLPGARGSDLFAAGGSGGEGGGDRPDAGQRAGDEVVFCETHRPQAKRTLFALRGERYKIIFDRTHGAWELYDLVSDPQEAHNLYAGNDARSQTWRRLLEARLTELGVAAGAEPVPPTVDAKRQRELRALGY